MYAYKLRQEGGEGKALSQRCLEFADLRRLAVGRGGVWVANDVRTGLEWSGRSRHLRLACCGRTRDSGHCLLEMGLCSCRRGVDIRLRSRLCGGKVLLASSDR